ncbi:MULTISPECIES: hypothetical protein [Nocardiopsis]|uniref:DUF320 domain-containing protein n=2 Tax=Nocardiopsis TaxID=2013 RepID=D7B8G6_NOCDD|nr:hypothetical protein [Nocardiopsis dassonvillei]ADH70474.1 conserved hypothetical protein [Nocardiopsis dassonvillei subsp. dassonvillei DSM 43111]APC33747.1 hypothetical protein A9R04_03065 [Nocardiopsis dassonvillei]NKY77104.1 hypothetical protein [Nocardiopsis dassonvillei]VEI91383.1 Uncharacterised protein [Nocardiopsis dassonvillei]
MLRKLGVVGLVAGAAFGVVLAGSPASASGSHGGDQQYNQNLQAIPVQLCNTDATVGLVAVTIPILSPDTTGDCTNGPVSTNID